MRRLTPIDVAMIVDATSCRWFLISQAEREVAGFLLNLGLAL